VRNLFVPPKGQFEDYTLQLRFELTWKMFMFNSIFVLLLSVLYFFFEYEAFGASVYAWVIAVGLHYLFIRTRRYRFIGFIYALHAVLFLTYTLNFMPNVIHAIEFFWMIVFIIYTFLAIGKTQGYVLLGLSVIGIGCYFTFHFASNVFTLNETLQPYQVTATIVNILVASVLIAYLINQFILLSSHSEALVATTNRELEAQNRLVQAQNEEKTIMLKEIHHRVKNNLQVISSLLRLQSHEITEEKAKLHFQDAVYRVIAMALIHEKMYQNKNLGQIDLHDYLESLASGLIDTYARNAEVSIDIESDIKSLGNDTLVPVALIFNELITNSLKHAFSEVNEGLISVEISDGKQPDTFSFIYRDNGTWKKEARDNSFGLELIATLTEQLDGRVSRTFDRGTKYEFHLRNIR